jgi:hypothetical protein
MQESGVGSPDLAFHIGVLDSASGSKEAGIMAQEPWTAERVREMMTNPIYCLSEPAIVAEDVWVAAGVKLIREIGAEKYLHMVLSNLRQTFEIKIRP